MRGWWQVFLSGVAVSLLLAPSGNLRGQSPPQSGSASPSTQYMDPRLSSGLNVQPVFEGFEPNPDGTSTLYFGYLNRNWEEEVDIPIGPHNFFDPGPQDRGQPTHFLPRRNKRIFGVVVVPKDFGDKKVVWTLTIRGMTDRVPGALTPVQQIDVRRQTLNNNLPPQLEVGSSQTIAFPGPATLTAMVGDDGVSSQERKLGKPGLESSRQFARLSPLQLNLFLRRELPREVGLIVKWSKYRGPGKVTFSDTVPAIQDDAGKGCTYESLCKAVTTATFSAPGEYLLQALADDGSMLDGTLNSNTPGYNCCWTTAVLKVIVRPQTSSAGER